MPNATASSARIPDATRIAAPAPACIAAPAGATGSTADADAAHTNASASAKFVPNPSAASNTKTPIVRSVQDAATAAHAQAASRGGVELAPSQRPIRKRETKPNRERRG